MSDRLELRLGATAEGIDWVRSLLATIDYAGEIDIRPIEGDSWPYRVRLYPAAGFEVDSIATTLYSLERTKLTSPLEAFSADEVSIAASPTISIGRFTIQPPDSQPTDQLTLQIGSTLAFGSGLHPATIVSLKLLDRHLSPSMQTLDLGSGSGILSVAMAKLGADVTAIDNDPIAAQATESTVKLNGVETQVQTMQGSLGQGSEFGHWMNGSSFGEVAAIRPIAQFDLIVANILAHLHLTLATDYQQALKPNGILITAGYTIDRAEEIGSAFQAVGFTEIDREMLDEWMAMAHRLSF
ncbi:MAG: 50S ribosomal protein L11 methyltransferase [Leptolyngbyaceae cyanobacterium SM1_3_5]|nr:50S ribosomal protein L11 methyltransferase [Leptolyngbyaceae cyanobacterium SM1_3_5]